jgi:ATP-dependent DNA helicase RecG
MPRNKLIAQTFYDIGFIERYGSGIHRMIDACKKMKIPEPEFQEKFGGFTIMFRKDVYSEKYLDQFDLNQRQIKAVLYAKEKGSIALSALKEFAPDVSEKTLYRDLVGLVEKGIFKHKGGTKSRVYILK